MADLEGADFVLVLGGKGSHRKFRHPKLAGSVILSGKDGDDAHHYPEKQVSNAIKPSGQMKPEDQYLKLVRWEEMDRLYVGYCPDLFPWGGVCHGSMEEETYRQICALVHEEVEQLRHCGKELPAASTRPMREAVPG